MIKLFFAAIPLSLAIGAAIGYRISEGEKEAIAIKLNREGAIAATIAPKPLSREELERRFTACIGKPLRLKAFSDKDLNDSLAECEALKAKN